MKTKIDHWLTNPGKETILIVLPLFIPVLIVFCFRGYFENQTELTSAWWLLLVLIIDVGHVYSTIFRFYWEGTTFQKYKNLLLIIPSAAFLIGFTLHYFDSFLFWRILAYIALYHFIRQQYGFVRLYSRKQSQTKGQAAIDAIAIYASTLYPVLYWHLHLTNSLSWFVPNDFIRLPNLNIDQWLLALYLISIALYTAKEMYVTVTTKDFNLPKNLIVLGTFLSWYTGIVFFHGDLAFTFLNVVAHGIPYMGLVWLYGEKKSTNNFSFGLYGAIIFVAVVVSLSYLEESLWDVMVWKDHLDLFPFLTDADPIHNHWILSAVVALLVLPQITHYVVDGFIWRFSKDSNARI
jgi:hypothetical protein